MNKTDEFNHKQKKIIKHQMEAHEKKSAVVIIHMNHVGNTRINMKLHTFLGCIRSIGAARK